MCEHGHRVMALLTDWRYTHIHGVIDEQIDTMLVANPRRYFE